MSDRTFKLSSPHMRGDDVKAWQRDLNRQMRTWSVDYQIPVDGDYDQATRALTASVCHGLGLSSASEAMEHGVTPELRIKLRNKRLTEDEQARYDDRAPWRTAFRRRHESTDVSAPITVILNDSWGYHPGVHDGVDLICNPNAALLAICDATVVRADSSGWWGLGAKASAGHPVSDGDGIIVLRSTTNSGPFKDGLNLCYGHAEHPTVRVGETVKAGQVIGRAGFANAWHAHFMVNGRSDTKGVGDRDPRPYLDYARRNA